MFVLEKGRYRCYKANIVGQRESIALTSSVQYNVSQDLKHAHNQDLSLICVKEKLINHNESDA